MVFVRAGKKTLWSQTAESPNVQHVLANSRIRRPVHWQAGLVTSVNGFSQQLPHCLVNKRSRARHSRFAAFAGRREKYVQAYSVLLLPATASRQRQCFFPFLPLTIRLVPRLFWVSSFGYVPRACLHLSRFPGILGWMQLSVSSVPWMM
jgi:hypothetical protein